MTWCEIKNYVGYYVSTNGDIKNKNGRILKQQLDRYGYYKICLSCKCTNEENQKYAAKLRSDSSSTIYNNYIKKYKNRLTVGKIKKLLKENDSLTVKEFMKTILINH